MPGGLDFSSSSTTRVSPTNQQLSVESGIGLGIRTGNRSPVNVTVSDQGAIQAGVDLIETAAATLAGSASELLGVTSQAAQINAQVSANATAVVGDIAAGSLNFARDTFGDASAAISAAVSRAFDSAGASRDAGLAAANTALASNQGLLATFADKLAAFATGATTAANAAAASSTATVANLAATSLRPDAGAYNESLKIGGAVAAVIVVAAIGLAVWSARRG